ncbi:metabolite traffic protein EboE [Massilia sp. BJB1822]|uniref:metabolite traffic protein EboE n=1 Tax=Massilia sp. BJB1822 TaxID=2744470 RepID=UPI0015936907|nr:metabolite traffic protein EboE [Massilia sp. BJB1822]NVE00187.1 metabolite traffic protein EboE [Massilia sp. BJB1822]
MRMSVGAGLTTLCYCSNIHAGESWQEVSASLEEYIPAVRAKLEEGALLAPGQAFGIGLRLSAQAVAVLEMEPALSAFQSQLDRLHAYVSTINAFPYGQFHGARVKEKVYMPDWRSAERLDYTASAARILARLLAPGEAGSISTVPGGLREALDADGIGLIARQLQQAVVMLRDLEASSGRCVVLALEPEPACLLENTDDVLDFFQRYLLNAQACTRLAGLAGVSPVQAEALTRRHLGICYDVCHAAVGFEEPAGALARLAVAGIAVPKLQLSSALRIPAMRADLLPALAALEQGVYLHQVVVQGQGRQHYGDLPEALAAFARGQARGEWRIHCHVPVFLAAGGAFASTQAQLRAALAALPDMAHVPLLEVETYTWDVLPPAFRPVSKAAAIARELAFIIEELRA